MRRLVFTLVVLSLTICAAAQGPTVFINGNTGISGSSNAFALGGVAVGGASIGKHDKTAEMAQILMKSCPEISLTVDEVNSHPDYLLVLHHEPGYYSGVGRIMVLRPDKSVLFASKQTRISRLMKDGCNAILDDWKDKRPRVTKKSEVPAPWKPAQ